MRGKITPTSSESEEISAIPCGDDVFCISARRGHIIYRSLIADGHYQKPAFDMFMDLAGDRSGVFVDVGANVGTTAIPASRCECVDHVIAIEPDRFNFACLQASVILSQREAHVSCLRCLAHSHDAALTISRNPTNCGDCRWTGKPRNDLEVLEWPSEPVSGRSLDSLINEKVGWLWVDAQGCESYVISGAVKLLASQKPALMLEIWPSQLADFELLVDILNATNYDVFHDGQRCDLKEVYRQYHDIQHPGHTDVVCV